MTTYRSIISLLLVTISISSCKIQEPEVSEVHSFKVDEFNKDEVKFRFVVDVENPNWFRIKIKKSNIDLYVSGSKVGKAKIKDKIVIKGKSSDSHTVYVVTDISGMSKRTLLKLAKTAMSGKAEVEAKGWVKAKALGIPKKVDVDLKEDLDLGSFGGFGGL